MPCAAARQKPLDVPAGMDEATFARPLRGGPSGVKPIGRRDREQTERAAVFKAYCDDIHVTLASAGCS